MTECYAVIGIILWFSYCWTLLTKVAIMNNALYIHVHKFFSLFLLISWGYSTWKWIIVSKDLNLFLKPLKSTLNCFLERSYQFKLLQNKVWESHSIFTSIVNNHCSSLILIGKKKKRHFIVLILISLIIGKVILISFICEHSIFCFYELSL